MIFLDIDGLKSVNDGLGHEVGDAFIREMADVIRHQSEGLSGNALWR